MNTRRKDVLIILGDAGFNYYGDKRDDKLKAEISSLNITLFCLHGNKENRPQNVGTYGIRSFCGGKVYYEPKYPNIFFAIDGEIYNFEGKKYMVAGGAHSVDKMRCLEEGKPFWEDEMPDDIYAYDSSWIYRKFWTPQTCFDAGRKAMLKKGVYTLICGLKPLQEKVEFSAEAALKSVARYLNPSDEKYSTYGDGYVYGIAVQECAAKYVGELFDGTIPYEKIDRRIFHLIWEHKKVMLERIRRIENAFGAGPEISPKYAALVKEAEIMRMLYASHHMKRRDAVLPVIQKKLLALKGEEERLLNELVEKGGVKNT